MNPDEENPEIQPPSPAAPLTPVPPGQIQWSLFFRAASPLAVVTGVISSILPPVGILLMLPLSLRRIIARYRPFHSGPLRASHGAQLGAFTALLSFAAFLVFFLATLSLHRTAIQEYAAQRSDPQSQQLAQLAASNEGFAVLMIYLAVFGLAGLLIAGAVSGALITRPRKPTITP